jgi:hypothetical protein
MNDFIECLVAQDFLNSGGMLSLNLIQLPSAIVDQTSGELLSMRAQAANALAHRE